MDILMVVAACCIILGFVLNCIDRVRRIAKRGKKMVKKEQKRKPGCNPAFQTNCTTRTG